MPCILQEWRAIEGLRRALDRDQPGWTEYSVTCQFHRAEHTLHRDPGQVPLATLAPEASGSTPRKLGGLPPVPKGRDPATWCVWHETSSPAVHGPCAWCGTDRLHVHRDALGTVRSGAAGAGYLVERCPACHQYNAVSPVYGTRPNHPAIRTARLEGDTPVIQLSLGGLR